MSLAEAILAFDGKHVDELRLAASIYDAADGQMLIEFCSSADPRCRIAATWIVNALLQKGMHDGLNLNAYFDRLKLETEWGALLHVLQSVALVPNMASNHLKDVARLVDHEKTLVSVWALDAYVRIALETNEGVQQARNAVEDALSHEKASMRARARHLAPLLGL